MTGPSSAESPKGAKRKGTRSVSTLNPAQLARKRANDREAQRAIRARTKDHIETLEKQLAERTQQSAAKDEEIRALKQEIYRLKSARPGTGHSFSSPAVFDDNLSPVSAVAPSPRSSPFPAAASGGYSAMPELGPSYVPLTPEASEPWAPGVAVPSNVSSPSSSANTDEFGAAYIPTSMPTSLLDARSVHVKVDYDDVDSARRRWLSSVAPPPPPAPSKDGGRPPIPPPSRALELISVPVLSDDASTLTRPSNTPFWELPSLIVAPQCAADQWIVSFVQECRQLLRTRHIGALFQPARVNLENLLEYHPPSANRPGPRIGIADLEQALDSMTMRTSMGTVSASGLGTGVSGAAFPVGGTGTPEGGGGAAAAPGRESSSPRPPPPHPIAELVGALADTMGVTGVMERLGIFVHAQRVLAWLVQPNKITYNALMPDLVPRPSQLTVPHNQWIDLVMQAPLRDVLIERPDLYATEEFQSIYSTSLRVANWPGRPVDAIAFQPDRGEVWLTEAFTAHALRQDNWRMDKAFVQRYPQLREVVAATGE